MLKQIGSFLKKVFEGKFSRHLETVKAKKKHETLFHLPSLPALGLSSFFGGGGNTNQKGYYSRYSGHSKTFKKNRRKELAKTAYCTRSR
jgi:hypothetical protein